MARTPKLDWGLLFNFAGAGLIHTELFEVPTDESMFTPPGLRLTTESGVPVSSTDRTAQGTLYWTPYTSGNVSFWDGIAWHQEQITEQSLALTITSGKNYDVFYKHGAGLSLSSAWTSDTARADALATKDGVPVNGADNQKLYIGTLRASGTNTTEDSGGITGTSQVGAKRFVWNQFNRLTRQMSVIDTTNSWTYNSTTIRQANAASGNKVEYVTGDAAQTIIGLLNITADADSAAAYAGVGVNSTTTFAGIRTIGRVVFGAIIGPNLAHYIGQPGLGYNYLSWNERTTGATRTFYGDNNETAGIQSGLRAMMDC